MNMLSAIGAYAAISRELGVPLVWPGSGRATPRRRMSGCWRVPCAWAARVRAAANQTFNVTNGDVFLWQDLFPLVARRFGMELGRRTRCRWPC